MSKIDKILSEVYKNEVKLESQGVQLALKDDVNKAYKDAIAARQKSFDDIQLLNKNIQQTLKNIQSYVNINQSAIPVFEKFEASAKSLGLDIPKEISQNKQNIQDGLKGNLTRYVKALSSIKL